MLYRQVLPVGYLAVTTRTQAGSILHQQFRVGAAVGCVAIDTAAFSNRPVYERSVELISQVGVTGYA